MKKELCVRLVIYKDYTEMHGQEYIKKNSEKNTRISMNTKCLNLNER